MADRIADFFAENGKKEGVKTTASGLQYKVIKSGAGKTPKNTDTVKVHYHGTLLNGTVFDSSVQRGEPISFPLNRVIPGWTEGLQLMKVGDKFKFEIPPNLAYGANPPTPKIPPNSTLVFEVELLCDVSDVERVLGSSFGFFDQRERSIDADIVDLRRYMTAENALATAEI